MSDDHKPGMTDFVGIADRIKKFREEGGEAAAFGFIFYKHESIDVEAALRGLVRSPEDTAKVWYAEYEAMKREVGRKQAEIDRLMLEYCPQEMTPEQIEEWRKHQVRVSPEQEAALERALQTPPQGEQQSTKEQS